MRTATGFFFMALKNQEVTGTIWPTAKHLPRFGNTLLTVEIIGAYNWSRQPTGGSEN